MASLKDKQNALLAEILREQRDDAGLRQTELAKKLGQRQNWISRLEAHQRRIDVGEFLELAKVIGFDPVVVLKRLMAEDARR